MFTSASAKAIPFEVYRDRHLSELRDKFAGLAMQGLMSNPDLDFEKTAEWAYKQADAMLKQRSKQE